MFMVGLEGFFLSLFICPWSVGNTDWVMLHFITTDHVPVESLNIAVNNQALLNSEDLALL